MSNCVDSYNFCIVRGCTFELDISLTSSYIEVVEDPDAYQATLQFREYQDDNLPILLTLTSDPTVVEEVDGQKYAQFTFVADTVETQALPAWDIVAFCELEYIGPTIGTAPITRLFNSKVSIID